MRSCRVGPFGATALGLVAVAVTYGWSVAQAPGVGGTGFALARATVLGLAAAQALHLCWLSAARWLVPAASPSRGWRRTEFALMTAAATLALAVMGVCIETLASEARIMLAIALCGALALALCALAYACGRIALLLRKRYKRRQHRVWRGSRGLRAGVASH